jgi:hypothetical protein
MLANVYVGELWRPSCVFSILIDGVLLQLSAAPAGWTIASCLAFERIETFYLHLSRTITAESSTRAFTCMHVTPRIACSPDPVSCIPTRAIVALEPSNTW